MKTLRTIMIPRRNNKTQPFYLDADSALGVELSRALDLLGECFHSKLDQRPAWFQHGRERAEKEVQSLWEEAWKRAESPDFYFDSDRVLHRK